MTIFIDCRFWGEKHTGLGRYCKNLVLELTKNKQFNFILLFNKALKQEALSLFKDNVGIKTLFTDIGHYSIKEQIYLPALLYKLKPDLVHFPHFNLPFFWQDKYIITIHDLIKHHSQGLATTTRHPLVYLIKLLGYRLIFAKAVAQAALILVPTQTIKRELKKIYPHLSSEKIVVTYEGVEKEFLLPQKLAKAKTVIKKPFLIYTGNAYPHKNLRRLILAVKILNEHLKLTITLVIVCSRDVFYARLKKEIAELKAERFCFLPGYLTDIELSNYYHQAKLFVSSSTMEGFGLPGLEAMACGCPVAVSNIATFKEVYGDAAYYFNPYDIDDIWQALKKIIVDPNTRNKLIRLGKVKVAQYSWHKCGQETLKAYRKLLTTNI